MSKRAPSALSSSTVASVDGPPQKAEALREAYKRHSSELVTIDEQQVKLALVILGIISAGATFLAPAKTDPASTLTFTAKFGLSLITGGLLWLWGWFTLERHTYRRAVRDLLVRCEMAMGFYENGVYLQGDKLYTNEELGFPSKGLVYRNTNLGIVVLAALGFLMVLWSPEISARLHPLAQRLWSMK